MDLRISVFLLFILFTAGHSLSCYECTSLDDTCANPMVKTCPNASSQCVSYTEVSQQDGVTFKMKAKGCAVGCISGSTNTDVVKRTSYCCNTDQCNIHDAPENNIKGPLSFTFTFPTPPSPPTPFTLGPIPTDSPHCPPPSIFDGAQSVTQSFLFLCCSLLSYFLLH